MTTKDTINASNFPLAQKHTLIKLFNNLNSSGPSGGETEAVGTAITSALINGESFTIEQAMTVVINALYDVGILTYDENGVYGDWDETRPPPGTGGGGVDM